MRDAGERDGASAAAGAAPGRPDWSLAAVEGADPGDCFDPRALEGARARFHARSRARDGRASGTGTGTGTDTDTDDVLSSLGAVAADGRPTRAGLLLLGTREAVAGHLGPVGCRISRQRRNGTLLVNKRWEGSLWDALERAGRLFRAFAGGVDRAVLDEAFINALAHRDYGAPGEVTVDFLEGRVDVTSPGGFPEGVNPDNLYRRGPAPRSPALARMLGELGLAEGSGGGAMRMAVRSLMRGRARPVFSDEGGSVRVVLDGSPGRKDVLAALPRRRRGRGREREPGVAELVVVRALLDEGEARVEDLVRELAEMVPATAGDVEAAAEGTGWLEVAEVDGVRRVRRKSSAPPPPRGLRARLAAVFGFLTR